jgi:hypothetical protein
MPKRNRFVTICLLTCAGVFALARPSFSQDTAVRDSVSTILEARIVAGADSCPAAVEVWLVATQDTIQAMELFLTWDRPDFVRFTTEEIALPALDTLVVGKSHADSKALSDRVIVKPVINRQGGLVEDWEYAEARGENGLAVKVAAFAYLAAGSDVSPVLPSESGLLFSLPVNVLPKPPMELIGDSAMVQMNVELTRLSNTKGNLINNIVLRPGVMRPSACWSSAPDR